LTQVSGFSGSSYRGYKTLADAQDAWDHSRANNTVGPPQTPSRTITHTLSIPSSSIQTRLHTAPPSPSLVRIPSSSVQTCLHTAPPSPSPVRQSGTPTQNAKWVPSSPPYLDLFSPVPSTPNRFPAVKIEFSPLTPHLALSDEAAFWVVISGANSGVYHGKYVISLGFSSLLTFISRAAASDAMGDYSPRRVLKLALARKLSMNFQSSTWMARL
jgi:hypothetical protein